MRKSSIRFFALTALLGAGTATALFASGSYVGRPPKPPKQGLEMQINQQKWELGKQVYNNESVRLGGGDVEVQRPRLQAVQAMLPPDIARDKDFVSLAGAFSEAQLDALEYFVKRRFPVKK